jgi:hypothetical protein
MKRSASSKPIQACGAPNTSRQLGAARHESALLDRAEVGTVSEVRFGINSYKIRCNSSSTINAKTARAKLGGLARSFNTAHTGPKPPASIQAAYPSALFFRSRTQFHGNSWRMPTDFGTQSLDRVPGVVTHATSADRQADGSKFLELHCERAGSSPACMVFPGRPFSTKPQRSLDPLQGRRCVAAN